MADRMLGVAVRTFSFDSPAGVSLVQYVPKTGAAYNIRAVFDKAYISVDPNTGAPVQSTDPILGVRRSDLAAEPKPGDRVVVNGTTYSIGEPQPDGVAGILFQLHKL